MEHDTLRRVGTTLLVFAAVAAAAAVVLFVLASQASEQALVDDYTGVLAGMGFDGGGEQRGRASLFTILAWVSAALTVVFAGIGIALRPPKG